MRDPCLLQGPDGTFHMVWTDSWHDRTIGYARSRDLLHWSPQKALPVMLHEPTARNCWAPEIVYDETRRRFLIFWATTIPGRFPETESSAEGDHNHRMYCTTTEDFRTFTPTRLFYDGGFNVIDATLLQDGGWFYLFVKDETLKPVPKKHLRMARSRDLEGPYTDLSEPFTQSWVEGPAAIKIGSEYRVYYDAYREHRYGAVRSRDLVTWEDISERVVFPPGTRHGTVLRVARELILRLLKEGPR
jgi:beta-xylosidase